MTEVRASQVVEIDVDRRSGEEERRWSESQRQGMTSAGNSGHEVATGQTDTCEHEERDHCDANGGSWRKSSGDSDSSAGLSPAPWRSPPPEYPLERARLDLAHRPRQRESPAEACPARKQRDDEDGTALRMPAEKGNPNWQKVQKEYDGKCRKPFRRLRRTGQ